MFTKGFTKIAVGTASIVPRSLQNMTGTNAHEIFGKPVRKFARGGKKALVPLSRLVDGLK